MVVSSGTGVLDVTPSPLLRSDAKFRSLRRRAAGLDLAA
jgi:hypothetical protein